MPAEEINRQSPEGNSLKSIPAPGAEIRNNLLQESAAADETTATLSVELRRQLETGFQAWLEELSRSPSPAPPAAAASAPDLFSVFAEISALRQELRRHLQKNQQAGQELDSNLNELKLNLQAAAEKADEPPLLARALIDLYERFARLRRRAAVKPEPPRSSWRFFSRRPAAGQSEAARAGENLLQGMKLIEKRMLELLAEQRIFPLETIGRPFDPHSMKAETVVERPELPADQVVEEISRGWLYRDQPLKFAEVAVNRPAQPQIQTENLSEKLSKRPEEKS